jgi:hypothetical protein
MVDIDNLVRGAIDMHIHSAPVDMPCLDALEIASQARQAGMRAIVLKHHSFPTAPLAHLVRQVVPGISVFGSICLEYDIGGLNPHAVEASAKLGGAKVVWMPTISAANSRDKLKKMDHGPGPNLKGAGYSIMDENGALLADIEGILSLVKEFDMVLASGHMSPGETLALFKAARKAGIEKLVVTHPSNTEVVDQALSLEDLRQLVKMGAFIEHTAIITMPGPYNHNPTETAELIKAIGAQHCIMSTDLGPKLTPPPVEGMKIFISSLLGLGITPNEIELMVKVNPAKLLGLDSKKMEAN